MAPRACQLCLEALKWAPVVFITLIVGWSYYAYVVQLCILTADTMYEKVLFLVFYHPIFMLFLWSFYRTIFAKVRLPPKEFHLSKTEWQRLESESNENVQKELLENFARKLPLQNRTVAGFPRYCEKCKCVKPDRSHHCSVCSLCVQKMDHHCPWVNNCVGFHNYKFFILFLGYALLYCVYVSLTSLKYFIDFWSNGGGTGVGRFHVLFLFFVSIMFGISVMSLFLYHIWLSLHNRSNLEAFRAPIFQTGPDKDGFSLGASTNMAEVFGDQKKLWFLPVFTSRGDGVSYASRLQPTLNYNTMGSTPSLGDGVTYPTRTVDLDSDGLLGQRQRWMEEGDNGKKSDVNDVAFANGGVDLA